MTTINAFPLELPPLAVAPDEQRSAALYDAMALVLVLAARDVLPPETRRIALDILRRVGYGSEHIAAVAAHHAIAQSIERART